MSTRCQVKVTGTDINMADSHTLYHHCDGYPEYMLPTIAKGLIDSWQAGRIGKAAVMIASADTTGYEMEQGHEIHGDIDYYYVVDVSNGNWIISVYDCPFDANSIHDMTLIGTYSVEEAANYSD